MKSALAIARDVRDGRCTALSIVDKTIAAIERGDGAINSFVTRTFDRARREAAAIDARRARGESLPALAGVPYAVKNLFDAEGVVTLAGGRVNERNAAATRDATLVRKMHDAGAILVGALNMDEHAYGFTTENTHYGPTRNPRDPSRSAGGSSGGSAAAVAAGFVPLTLGSDTNGSIRVPSSFCGTFGLKPTYGRLSRHGTFPFVSSLDHLGPFAASVDDLAACYDAMQGPDDDDVASAQRPIEAVGSRVDDARPLRIGVLGGYFEQWATEPARRAVALAANALGSVDTRDRVDWVSAPLARSAAFVITASEAGALHRRRLQSHYDEYEPHSRDRLIAGSLVPASWLVHAQRVRRQCLDDALELFEHYDVLLAPATPMPATPIGTETIEINGTKLPCRPSIGLLTQPVSCIGLPVCVAPVWPGAVAPARDDAHMPIGVQIIAAPWREDLCLAVARQLEAAGVASTRIAGMAEARIE